MFVIDVSYWEKAPKQESFPIYSIHLIFHH